MGENLSAKDKTIYVRKGVFGVSMTEISNT